MFELHWMSFILLWQINKRINQIQASEILQVIKKIEARGSLEIAKRILSRCDMDIIFIS